MSIWLINSRWLRGAFPSVPEEMITELRQYLTSDSLLAEVAYHVGIRELVLSQEYPPAASSLKTCFQALIGELCIIYWKFCEIYPG